MRTVLCIATVLLLAGTAQAQMSPFSVVATYDPQTQTLAVDFTIPADHYLYADQIRVAATAPEGVTLSPRDIPPPARKFDEFLDMEIEYYGHDVRLVYAVTGAGKGAPTVTVDYQGCDATTCFLPESRTFPGDAVTPPPDPGASGDPAEAGTPVPADLAGRFRVVGTETGFLTTPALLKFIADAESGRANRGNVLERVFSRFGLLAAMILIIPLGLLLNLTPCVLPMIPINLAIIGAGTSSGSKKRGFALGGTYGLGMAMVYGILGVVVILAGARFGALNSSPWFNVGIAAVFVVLGLAMFDVLVIDLSRFSRPGPGASPAGGRRPFVTAFVLGGTAALLAGACVAPVVIWVVVLATDLYAKGNAAGLFLPFLLGVGMALPWPMAGAGLTVMPRPGAWMNKLKYAMGVLILGFALYYGKLAVSLFQARAPRDPVSPDVAAELEAGWLASLPEGFALAADEGKPIFLDFWALSCKSCMKMKKTTFVDPEALAALDGYVKIALQTDDANDPVVKWALKEYGVIGLPTFIVLKPRETAGSAP